MSMMLKGNTLSIATISHKTSGQLSHHSPSDTSESVKSHLRWLLLEERKRLMNEPRMKC